MTQNPVNSEIPRAKSPGNVAVKVGFQAIKSSRYDMTDSARLGVSVYKDGTVVDRASGEFLQSASDDFEYKFLRLMQVLIGTQGQITTGVDGSKTGTGATQLTATPTPCRYVVISKIEGNTNNVRIGLTNQVSSTVGGWYVGSNIPTVTIPVSDASLIYFCPVTAGEGVSYTIVQ